MKLSWRVNGGEVKSMNRDCGLVPIMVRVSDCLLVIH